MPQIQSLTGLEILDSRGRPTVGATCRLRSGATAWASVPSGASTGRAEAVELRDGDRTRYGGLGCQKAAEHISRDVNDALCGIVNGIADIGTSSTSWIGTCPPACFPPLKRFTVSR